MDTTTSPGVHVSESTVVLLGTPVTPWRVRTVVCPGLTYLSGLGGVTGRDSHVGDHPGGFVV